MAVMVIFLVVAIATTLGAAGRAAGLLSILPRTVTGILGDCRGDSWGWGVATSCLSRRHNQPHGTTTGRRYSRCDGRGIRPLP